jgi:two-component system LytT family response regulator
MIDRVLVVDDEPLARERVVNLVRTLAPAATIREAGNGDAAVDAIRSWSPQVVFLDVQMPGQDGFGVVSTIGPAALPPTIFVTAFDAHAVRAFDAAAVDYLLKPFDDARFVAAWQRVERAHASRLLVGEADRLSALLAAVAGGVASPPPASPAAFPERFVVRDGERTYLVPVADVRWMQSDGNYITLYTATATHSIREPLASLEQRLDPALFVRIHRRIIVAIRCIREMQPWFAGDQVLILDDGTKLRVTRTRREAVAARLAGGR